MKNDNIEEAEVDTDNLVTVKSFAKLCDVSTAFIYKAFSDVKSTTQILKSLKRLIKSKKNV